MGRKAGRTEAPRRRALRRPGSGEWRAHLIMVAVCIVPLLLLHLPFLNLPYFWDEAGYYIPAARDFFLTGNPIPHSTVSNPHPPLLSIYLAAAWKLFGFTPLVTRLAMGVLAGLAIYAVLLLALPVASPAAGLWAAALTALSPVFFAQSTLAHLDVAATLGTLVFLYFYVLRRPVACLAAGTLLCLARETGAVVILTAAALELWDRRSGEARAAEPAGSGGQQARGLPMLAALLLALLPLAAWFVFLRWRTGLWLGDPEFAQYNVLGVLNPVRWLLQLAKRVYQLSLANFHWLATLLIVIAAWRSAFSMPRRALRALVAVITGYVAFLSVFGGAPLTRYLLPALPLFFLLAADAATSLRWRGRQAAMVLLPAALVACWYWKPPYPYSYEDNLAYADFVRLHQAAVPTLEQLPSGSRILTAWPATDELTRPWLGYVRAPLKVVRLSEFSHEELDSLSGDEFDVVFLFSRQWHPDWFDEFPRLTALQRRYFGYRQQAPAVLLRERFGMFRRMRTELRGQWVEIWVKSHTDNKQRPSSPQKIRRNTPTIGSAPDMQTSYLWLSTR